VALICAKLLPAAVERPFVTGRQLGDDKAAADSKVNELDKPGHETRSAFVERAILKAGIGGTDLPTAF
jgi:hypothetical protein